MWHLKTFCLTPAKLNVYFFNFLFFFRDFEFKTFLVFVALPIWGWNVKKLAKQQNNKIRNSSPSLSYCCKFSQLEQYLCHLLAVHACQIRISNAQYLISAAEALVLRSHTSTIVNKYIHNFPALKTQHSISSVLDKCFMYLCVCGRRPCRHTIATKILQQGNAAVFAEAETCKEQMRKKNVASIRKHTIAQNIWKRELRQIANKSQTHKATGGARVVH